MRYFFDLPPSLHRPDLRLSFRAQLEAKCKTKIPPRIYRVSVTFYGDFFDKHGLPRNNKPDGANLIKPLFDEFARAMKWPRGNDCWLECDVHYRRLQAQRSYCEMELA